MDQVQVEGKSLRSQPKRHPKTHGPRQGGSFTSQSKEVDNKSSSLGQVEGKSIRSRPKRPSESLGPRDVTSTPGSPGCRSSPAGTGGPGSRGPLDPGMKRLDKRTASNQRQALQGWLSRTGGKGGSAESADSAGAATGRKPGTGPGPGEVWRGREGCQEQPTTTLGPEGVGGQTEGQGGSRT